MIDSIIRSSVDKWLLTVLLGHQMIVDSIIRSSVDKWLLTVLLGHL